MAQRKRKSRPGVVLGLCWAIMTMAGALIRRGAGLIVLAVLLAGVLLWFKGYCLAPRSPFVVETFDITPTQFIARDVILKTVNIRTGTNMFRADIKGAGARLERFARVKKAAVQRVFPHTIRIEIIERQAVAQVVLNSAAAYYPVDMDGVVVAAPTSQPRADWDSIAIENVRVRMLHPGDAVPASTVRKTKALIAKIKTHEAFKNEVIRCVGYDQAENMTLRLSDGLEIKVGDALENLIDKLDVVREIMQGAERVTIEYIDVRFKDVVVKRKASAK